MFSQQPRASPTRNIWHLLATKSNARLGLTSARPWVASLLSRSLRRDYDLSSYLMAAMAVVVTIKASRSPSMSNPRIGLLMLTNNLVSIRTSNSTQPRDNGDLLSSKRNQPNRFKVCLDPYKSRTAKREWMMTVTMTTNPFNRRENRLRSRSLKSIY
jgi:hypothetical protein